jgi:thiol-disulfide isomerase/thioredoxin
MACFFRRALVVLVLGVLVAGCDDPGGVAGGKPAPDIVGTDLDDKPLDLKEFRGKVVMLSFWAGWCGPCVHLIPHEQELARRYEGKPFVLLGVNKDHTVEKGRQAQESNGVTWRSFWDGKDEIIAAYDVDAYPYVFLIDHKGEVQFSTRGVSPATEKELDKRLETLVKEAEAAR